MYIFYNIRKVFFIFIILLLVLSLIILFTFFSIALIPIIILIFLLRKYFLKKILFAKFNYNESENDFKKNKGYIDVDFKKEDEKEIK